MPRPDLRQRQGEKRADWLERVRATQAAEAPQRSSRLARSRRCYKVEQAPRDYESRLDDLGESPDY